MRILEITFIPPSLHSGGGLCVYQSIKSLLSYGYVDYIGPDFDERIFYNNSNYSINKHKILQSHNTNIFKKIVRLFLHKVSTSYYDDWCDIKDGIDWNRYAFVHIDFSRYSFLVDECHSNKKKCIIRFHNIESDYGYNLFRLTLTVSSFFRFLSFKINERRVAIRGDYLLFITKKDQDRGERLYKKINSHDINPICIESKNRIKRKNLSASQIKLLMTGTLNYEPNVRGIIWFIENVWNSLTNEITNKDLMLTISGYSPSNELKNVASQYKHLQIIDSPSNMEEYFTEADIYIASIFDGAGMKVKVAEAFSYGIPTIGTPHAFIGFEKINQGKYIVKNEFEFLDTLVSIISGNIVLPDSELIVEEFEKYFSMHSSIERYEKYIQEVIS